MKVPDKKFPKRSRLIPYDGRVDALFSSRKEHIFTRELLDPWLWDVSGTGGKFRDAFYSWLSKSSISSASCHRLGNERDFARKRGNEAFSTFLKMLSFPNDEDLFDLNSCLKCERTLHDGTKRMDGVVMCIG